MPHFSRQSISRRCRAAWFPLLLCLWMATGGVLHHADGAWAANHASASLTTASLPLILTPCAACEWAQGALSFGVAVTHFSLPLVFARPGAIVIVSFPRPRPVRLFSLRAPPDFLSSLV